MVQKTNKSGHIYYCNTVKYVLCSPKFKKKNSKLSSDCHKTVQILMLRLIKINQNYTIHNSIFTIDKIFLAT